AEEALRHMHQRAAVDLVITDLYMPGIDGWRFCRLLRSPEYAAFNTTPILVVSATYSGEDAERITADLGANAFLSIPYDPPVLLARVRALLEKRSPPPTIRTLIVEDDEALARLLRQAFQRHGYVTSVATTGAEARRLYREHKPEIAVVDYYLPDMTGDRLLKEFKQPGSSTVVIMITGDQNPERAVQLMQDGADDFVRKPFDPAYLIGICQRARRQRALLRVEELLEERTHQLQESERLFRTLAETISAGVYIYRGDRYIYANSAAEAITGYTRDELLKMKVWDPIHPDSRQLIKQRTEARQRGDPVPSRYELKLLTKTGEERWVDVTASIIRFQDKPAVLVTAFDITERKKMEAELLKAQKLESLGLLAGGIAHDFNNFLMAILGNISLARLEADSPENLSERLMAAERACLRAKDLTQQLLTFSKGGTPIRKLTSIAELIKESAEFVLRGSNVRCQFSIADDLWPVEIDIGQMSQVIQNLIINADQASPNGGTITIRAQNVTLDEGDVPPLKAGRYVKIAIEDHGIGIPREHLSKIFDPYFTTKQKGSGLGLSIVYSIVKKHDGHITVRSELGRGTTFTIYLPASGEAPTRETPETARTEDTSSSRGGRILVMDDEEIIRDVTRHILERLGYDVALARDGEEAIQMYRDAQRRGRPFDAVIMDLTVPGGMGGKEAIRRLRTIDPQVKAIVASGYSNDPIMANYRAYGFDGVVAKPYRIEELRRVLHQVLTSTETANDVPPSGILQWPDAPPENREPKLSS
ncbi:MAG: hybrid sensor histidine kinase/response regulator, partial [Acidobacteria bacterium]